MDPGFKLCASVLKRAAGRPRKSRIRPRSEGAGLGARKRKCTRCGGFGHFGKYCDNTVDPAFGECFDKGFDEIVGQQPVATDDENDGQQPVATDEDFDEVPNDDGQQPHDFDDDPKYPPNDDSSEAPNDDPSEDPNGDPSEAPNGDPSEAPNDDPSEAPNGDQPSVVVSSARYVNLANTTVHLSLDMISLPFMFCTALR
jgi:hypothetical protein